ncbi:MAG TPA: hypothetical protein VL494_13810 [Steroidobacteraceae bacterium]|jgi:hypothetical protein|nr:hypothetical protein [Steroidobacteraceae bacterium]
MLRRAQQQTVTIIAIDTSNPPARKSGLTLLNTDVKISKDGGSFTSATNAPSEIGSTGRYALVLTAAETDCIWLHWYVEKTGMQPFDKEGSTSGHPSGQVLTDPSNTSSTFKTDLASSTTDFWKDTFMTFTSGALLGQTKKVTGYNGSTKFLTFLSGFTGTPSNGDRFVLVNV